MGIGAVNIQSFDNLHGQFNEANAFFEKRAYLHNVIKKPGNTPVAFGPEELHIGSVVYGRLKRVFGEVYGKEVDDVRPMLVTGLWRRGEDIVKIELMKFTSRFKQGHPEDFVLDTTNLMKNGQKYLSALRTSAIYIIDNSDHFFPHADNPQTVHLRGDLWMDILLRRAYSILFNARSIAYGNIAGKNNVGLEREGFIFPNLPVASIFSDYYVPEVQHENSVYNEAVALPQDLIDTIVRFAGAYTQMMQAQGHKEFEFPLAKDMPEEIPAIPFPHWRVPPIEIEPQFSELAL